MLQKNVLFFLSQAPTHHSFTFNSRLLYELRHKVRLSKTVWEIFIFDCFKFSILFKKHGLFDLKRHNSEQESGGMHLYHS